ncbi:MAG: response regulator [Nitrospirae bacterium]|nr:response regulator [Candidatus Manganitrophaceae bacterium]
MQKIKILLVDDHWENLIALQALLDSPLYELVSVLSGREALKKLLIEEDFALILLDVCMPDLDGLETAALIKKRPKVREIPIIFLTAINKEDRFVFEGYAIGAVDYLFKPFEPMILRSKVAVFTELYRSREQIRRQTELLRQIERREHERHLLEQELALRERYKNLADAIPQIVWFADKNGEMEACNVRWFDYTGLSEEESVGDRWNRAVHSGDLSETAHRWAEAIRTGRAFETECRLRGIEGGYRWHLVRGIPERNRDGEIVAWLGTFTDIEDQKRNEEALKQKTLEAEEANRTKSEFLSNVSHELRTPLNAIIGYGSLLLEGAYGDVTEEAKGPLEGVQRNATDLLSLINHLLDLSKIESGEMPVHVDTVDLKSLLAEVVHDANALIKGRPVEMGCHIPEDLSPIESDASKIRQIILNLLSNAVKFTERGSVTLTACHLEQGIRISVKDTGVGMKAEDIPRIFERFQQLDGSLTRKAGGTGLGLTIVKNLITLLQGRIEVESTAGVGSTFTVFLPKSLSFPLSPSQASQLSA